MKIIQIINPKAGHGRAEEVQLSKDDVIRYTTTGVGDAETAVKNFCCEHDDELHFIVCGGDGTINEVVNGIMSANAQERAIFSVAPTGSGNDFIKNFSGEKKKYRIDLIKYNGRYAVNMINIGFDCDVVSKTDLYKNKKMISGSMAYIMGVGNVLLHKLGKHMEISITTAYDTVKVFSGEFLLCPIANGSFCGGGFNALPLAELNDGLLDMLIVDKISRAKFIKLVSAYRAGTYIDKNTEEIKKEFSEILRFFRIKKAYIRNLTHICADGEIENAETIEVEVAPKAITYFG